MSNEKNQQGVVVGLITFLILSLGSSLLFLFAFVLWLAELLNSLSISLLLTGGVLAIVAFIAYRVSLHPILRQIKRDIETISQLATTLRNGYRWILEQLSSLLLLTKKSPTNE